MVKKLKPIRIPFLAEVKDALASINSLEDGVSDLDKAADESKAAFAKLGDNAEGAAREANAAMRKLGLTSAMSFKEQETAARDSYKKIADTFGETSTEAQRAYTAMQKKVARINRLMATDTKKTFADASKDIGKKLTTIGKSITTKALAASAAVAAAGGALITNTSQNALEVDRASKVAGLDIRRMQELGFAAASVGIETEDVADKLKDVNDKFGDFFETGAGPMADFFQNVAPKIGLTAKMFKKMNSADRMQAFVNALEKSGKTLEDGATFYLEGLASDSTKLFELFSNNGKRLNELAAIGRRTGGFFTEEDIENAKRMQLETLKVRSSMNGLGAALLDAGVVEAFVAITEKITALVRFLTENVNPTVLKIGVILSGVLIIIVPIIAAIAFMAAGIAVLASTLGPIAVAIAGIAVALVAVAAVLAAFWDDIRGFYQEFLVEMRETILAALPEPFANALRKIADMFSGFFGMIKDGLTYAITSPFEAAKEAAKAFLKYVMNPLGRVVAVLELAGVDVSLDKLPGFATGGIDIRGPGTGTSDSILARLSNGESVLTAAATRFWGPDFLTSINNMVMPPQLAMAAPAMAGPTSSGRRVSIDLGSGGESYMVETDERTAEAMGRHFRRKAATRYGRKSRFAR